MLSHDEQTIIAQCTPQGAGAIALLRLSGDDAVAIADRIAQLSSGKRLIDVPTHTIHYGNVVDKAGTVLDNVLFLVMHGPRSFTGQHTVEITCHNNPFICQAIIAAARDAGARLAQEGEFSKRAVLNDKIDLLQAEAINELINANNEQSLKQSLAQLGGSFSAHIQAIEKELISALAFTNASFEFIEEENIEFGTTIKQIVTSLRTQIATLRSSFDQQKQLRSGIKIALIGSVNAGKSSLFNGLIGQNRAIVTDQAGTTRDVIEAGFYEQGSYWTLIDTAGLRTTNDLIEKEGIKRSYEQAATADIILLIIDSARLLSDQERTIYNDLYTRYSDKIIPVMTKADLPTVIEPLFAKTVQLCTADRASIQPLKEAIFTKAGELFALLKSPYLLNQRQFNLMIELDKNLQEIDLLLGTDIAYELIAYHITQALAQCSQMTGKTVTEEAMDAVFKEFCVGK